MCLLLVVAQPLHVQSAVPFSQNESQQEFLIVNAHLLFPHDSVLSIARLHQVQYCCLVLYFAFSYIVALVYLP